jgi:hypothetical protein
MQRGILILSKQESSIAIELAQSSAQDLTNMISKLKLAINSPEDTSTIEVDREEVETLLDALSMPSDDENYNNKLLRSNLSRFLSSKSG